MIIFLIIFNKFKFMSANSENIKSLNYDYNFKRFEQYFM